MAPVRLTPRMAPVRLSPTAAGGKINQKLIRAAAAGTTKRFGVWNPKPMQRAAASATVSVERWLVRTVSQKQQRPGPVKLPVKQMTKDRKAGRRKVQSTTAVGASRLQDVTAR